MNWNSALPLAGATINELEDGLGLPQFQGQDSFYFVQNGLIIQGGKLASLAIGNHLLALPAPFTQQILSIQLTEIGGTGFIRVNPATTTLDTIGLTVSVGATESYWFAIGA